MACRQLEVYHIGIVTHTGHQYYHSLPLHVLLAFTPAFYLARELVHIVQINVACDLSHDSHVHTGCVRQLTPLNRLNGHSCSMVLAVVPACEHTIMMLIRCRHDYIVYSLHQKIELLVQRGRAIEEKRHCS